MTTVLVVDDEQLLVKGLKRSLEQEGYKVLTAHDGFAAVEVFGNEKVDLIVLDIMLPGLNGLEVCSAVRREKNTPIIMLTAKGEDVDRIVGLELGADDYVVKPFNTRELIARIRAVLRRAQTGPREEDVDESWLQNRQLRHREVVSALAGSSTAGFHRLGDNERVMYVAVPVRQDKAVQGVVMLVVGVNDIYETLNQVAARMILVSVLSALLAAVLSLALAGVFTRPVNRLTRAVRHMEQGRLDQRVPTRSEDELGELARAFNSMSSRLEQTERHRREFIANASHELRSPLSSIKALSQALVDSGEKDPAMYREYLRDIDSEMDRLNRLVENLLQLARMEEQELQVHKEEQEVAGVVIHVADFMEPLAAARNVRLTTAVSGRPVWPLDRDLVIRVLFNLVDNAIRYTPAGGEVRIEAEVRRRELVLRVRDTGEGIPEADQEHVFDRFYRVDKARSMATGGTGLGLAIVRQAVGLHGGRITVESIPGKGTAFEICFPK
ncbi:MAG: response regulator [Candidatus Desulforudis sp.]|nr:response regulator [Desulforudis sp.]